MIGRLLCRSVWLVFRQTNFYLFIYLFIEFEVGLQKNLFNLLLWGRDKLVKLNIECRV